MPVMDGLEAASRIQELDTGIPIIAMTANIMSNDREIYRNNGMYDCVGKPFTSQELWRCLMKYLTPLNKNNAEKNILLEADAEYHKMLQVYFVKSNQKKCEEIAGALQEGDIELAYRMAHTLKGNAGQLGKTILQKAAADVERQLKGGKNLVTPEQLKILENELTMVLNEFSLKV
jgi:CheY-like chemotaxis protein